VIKITKAELSLAVDRLLVDAEDDFFPDPLRFRDLRLLKKDIVAYISPRLRKSLAILEQKPQSGYLAEQFFHWDVPKGHDVVRHAVCIHPVDRVVFNFVLLRLMPLIEPKLSKARYSYRTNRFKARRPFGNRSTKNWLQLKEDAKTFFDAHRSYSCMVSTDVAAFYEYTHIRDFKNALRNIVGGEDSSFLLMLELLNSLLKRFSWSGHDGIPQNYDPSSYLASAFLDFLDKELEARGFRHFRYVDDIKVACHNRRHAQNAIVEIIRALRQFNLNLSTAKTQIWDRTGSEFLEFFRDFPSILDQVDDAVANKDKDGVDAALPSLVRLTKGVMAKRGRGFNERLFRACIWRILKCHWFKNIHPVSLDGIAKRCLGLLDEMPARTDAFARFLVLLKDRKFVQSACAEVIASTVYPWQEQVLWELLIKADRLADKRLLALARDHVRTRNDNCPAKNLAMVFLGKHGTYQDRQFIAATVEKTGSFMAKRCALISLQEYAQKASVYRAAVSGTSDIAIKALVMYLRQRKAPEYILDDEKIGSDLAFVKS